MHEALPYTYELRGKNVHVRRTSRIEVPIHMVRELFQQKVKICLELLMLS